MTTVTTTKRKFIFSDYMNTFIIESLLGLILLVWERGGRAKQILSSFIYIYIYRGLIQAIQMSGKRPKKLNYLIEFSTQINQLAKFPQFQAIYSSSRWKRTEMFQGFYPLNSPQGSVMNLLHNLQHLGTPSAFYSIPKLKPFSKTGISKTAWINKSLCVFLYLSRSIYLSIYLSISIFIYI